MKFIPIILFNLFLADFAIGQRIQEFNRLFNDPSPDKGRWALTLAANGYGFQNSVAHGFGSISLTSHFFIEKNSEFRLGAGYGGNRQSHTETDVSLLKLVSPKNYEPYAVFLGFSHQFEVDNKLLLGLNVDYTYTYKSFGSLPTLSLDAHFLTFGAELSSRTLPLSFGANFNYIFSGQAQSVLPGLNDNVIQVWDAFCLIEIPKWSADNWSSKKVKKISFSVAVGPNMVFINQHLRNQLGISDRFMPGLIVILKGSARFETK